MSKAIGLFEFNSIAKGIEVVDHCLKTADIKMIKASPTCPGKFIALFGGDVSSIKSAIEAGEKRSDGMIIDSFILANVHESVFAALYGAVPVERLRALGIIETFTVASAIVAADSVVKTADVTLLEVRTASGMGGKSIVLFTGDVGAVEMSLETASLKVEEEGLLVAKVLIPAPSSDLWESLF